jgi:hypothetical protein
MLLMTLSLQSADYNRHRLAEYIMQYGVTYKRAIDNNNNNNNQWTVIIMMKMIVVMMNNEEVK